MSKKFKRVFCIVIDSVGFGAEPDAESYGDVGTDTINHTAENTEHLKLPNMEKIGLGNLHYIKTIQPNPTPEGYYTRCKEISKGKDTLTGHWEIMGLNVAVPFKTFTDNGFPDDLIKLLEEKTGHKIIGNKSASGTEIIKELGEQEINEGKMIVYTSADSVLQICGHEESFDLKELYRCCEIAREITMAEKWRVGRVIARPYIGDSPENFTRTSNRHDYALSPYGTTVLDNLKAANYDVIGVGKINDIFNGSGISETHKSKSNVDGMNITIDLAKKDFNGLAFVNLVDFDALWGHRRNPIGYGEELERFDEKLGELIENLRKDDLLIITADHGNDPIHSGSDHTREMIPLFFFSKSLKGSGLLPIGDTFANIGATIADNFDVNQTEYGISYLNYLK